MPLVQKLQKISRDKKKEKESRQCKKYTRNQGPSPRINELQRNEAKAEDVVGTRRVAHLPDARQAAY